MQQEIWIVSYFCNLKVQEEWIVKVELIPASSLLGLNESLLSGSSQVLSYVHIFRSYRDIGHIRIHLCDLIFCCLPLSIHIPSKALRGRQSA